MSVTPRGMSVTEAYRIYKENSFIVNRRYQRKLVWTESEKSKLIDSIIRGYPIPLILLVETNEKMGRRYEIIDGMQRLNAIFSFIENVYPDCDGNFFDVNQLTRASQASKQDLSDGGFLVSENGPFLDEVKCANFVDYQLAVTIFTRENEEEINDIFGRINSQGRQLSRQDKRQAGCVTTFAQTVRLLSAEIRGDVSMDRLPLNDMPSISIATRSVPHGYGVIADQTFWCKQGILRTTNLRDSEDEQIIADIVATIIYNEPMAVSGDVYDSMYDESSLVSSDLNRKLIVYGVDRLREEVKQVFSQLIAVIEDHNNTSNTSNTLRNVVTGKASSNPVKAPFYAIYMAFFELMIKDGRIPYDSKGIISALNNCASNLESAKKQVTKERRVKNINLIKGLISNHFVKQDVPSLSHGYSLIVDFENSIKRSKIETVKYEFKQGICRLDGNNRQIEEAFFFKISKELCAIANSLDPKSNGYLYLGIADRESDAQKIKKLDNTDYINVEGVFIVGVGREAALLGLSVEDYVSKIINGIKGQKITESFKASILSKVDVFKYKGLDVIRFVVGRPSEVTFLDDNIYYKEGNCVVQATRGEQLKSIFKEFST